MNTRVTKDLSDNIKAAAILSDFFGYRPVFVNTAGSRGGSMLQDKSGSPKVVTFKGSNNIPLKIGDNWYFCDTDVDITLPNDLDDYVADSVLEDGSGVWTPSANVSYAADTGQVKLAIAGPFTTGLVAYRNITAVDMTAAGVNAISLLIKSDTTLGGGALRLAIDEHAGCVSPDYLTIPGLKANVQTRVIIPLAGIVAANRDVVISLGLDAAADPGAINVWLDDIKLTSIEAGQDYNVYACDSAGTLVFKASTESTYPAGFAAATSRKIGGMHTLALAVGTIGGHTLTGYDTADVNPYSIWDLKHRARNGVNAGLAYDPQSRLWVDIYLASGTGSSTLSVNGGTISDTQDWNRFVDDGGAVGKRLLRDDEFQVAASGSNEQTNIFASADPVVSAGHIDGAGRRMISNIGLEDCCGAMWQWLLDQSYRWDSDGTMAAAGKTAAVTHVASPEGNPIYLKYGPIGRPYLCCNMASAAADKFVTFGSAVTVCIKHEAAAAVGSYQVYFDEDATQPGRLLCALPGLKTEYLDTSDPNYPLQVVYNAAPGTPGVAVNYDDVTHLRLEFTSPTAADGTIDLAGFSMALAWQSLSDSRGRFYRQGTYGDIKLLAGGAWYISYCGSRSRAADSYRWHTYFNLGARFAVEPQ